MGVDLRASGARDSAVAGLVLCALLGFAWARADALLDEPAPEFAAGEIRSFELADGSTSVAVSASPQGDIVVQNLGGDEPAAPKVAYRAGSRTLVDLQIRVGGPTLAVAATFTLPDSYYLNELTAKGVTTDDVTVFVVCRDDSCTVSREYAGTPDAPPEVAPDGHRVLLAELDGTRVTWQGGSIAEQ